MKTENTCSLGKARENVCERLTADPVCSSDWMKSGASFLGQSCSAVTKNHLPFETQVKNRSNVYGLFLEGKKCFGFISLCMKVSCLKKYFFALLLKMETRKHITDRIQERFKELKVETQLLHSEWR